MGAAAAATCHGVLQQVLGHLRCRSKGKAEGMGAQWLEEWWVGGACGMDVSGGGAGVKRQQHSLEAPGVQAGVAMKGAGGGSTQVAR